MMLGLPDKILLKKIVVLYIIHEKVPFAFFFSILTIKVTKLLTS